MKIKGAEANSKSFDGEGFAFIPIKIWGDGLAPPPPCPPGSDGTAAW